MNGVLAHSLAPYLAEQYCKIHLSAQKLCRRAKWAEKNETYYPYIISACWRFFFSIFSLPHILHQSIQKDFRKTKQHHKIVMPVSLLASYGSKACLVEPL
jgi:hypothetical protein